MDENEEKETWRPLEGATSFSQVEALMEQRRLADEIDELNWVLRTIVNNIVSDPDIADKAAAMQAAIVEYADRTQKISQNKGFWSKVKSLFETPDPFELISEKAAYKRQNGLDYPSTDFAYTPDVDKPATWQLRLTEAPGKITISQLNKATASLGAVSIPSTALSAVKRRIRQEYRKLGVAESNIPQQVKALDDSALHIWKDASGQYHFVAIYSNNIRDDDRPAEIISEKAHKRFAEAVQKGYVKPPELWHWHKEGTRWGEVQNIFVVDGFPVALGIIDPGHEKEAEQISELPYPVAMSHGMPRKMIVRNDEDPSIIDFYVSTEISTLPRLKAANKLTGFQVFSHYKESDMPLTEEQVKFFHDVGVPEATIASLGTLDEVGKAAEAQGRDRKEQTEETVEEEPTEVKQEIDLSEYVTRKEVADTLENLLPTLVNSIKGLSERVAILEATSAEKQAAAKSQAELAPKASLSDMMRQSLFGEAAEVKEESPLAGQSPQETTQDEVAITGSPFLDNLIQNSAARYNGQ